MHYRYWEQGRFLYRRGYCSFFRERLFWGRVVSFICDHSRLRQILEPRLVGNHVGLSPLLILLSIYLGLMIYGGFGFILGPLSALLLYGIFREWDLLLA